MLSSLRRWRAGIKHLAARFWQEEHWRSQWHPAPGQDGAVQTPACVSAKKSGGRNDKLDRKGLAARALADFDKLSPGKPVASDAKPSSLRVRWRRALRCVVFVFECRGLAFAVVGLAGDRPLPVGWLVVCGHRLLGLLGRQRCICGILACTGWGRGRKLTVRGRCSDRRPAGSVLRR